MSTRRPTTTSTFGVSRRESHDASAFYARFSQPELTSDERVALPSVVADPFICGDAREMRAIEDNSVALVVTSPPYFAGKQYELELGEDGVPGSYIEYLELLRDVFRECKRVLEPGGRIAVNVANLGRKPFRSLAGDVSTILQDDLQMLLRGEIVWKKGDGASGSCAWGSFRSPMNPVLRDLTERVVIASKGRFDRALNQQSRAARDLPWQSSISSDEFMAATLDLWEIAPESARRVEHPAPFPVELPQRLIELYTFVDDLVLDPFMGSGSTLVAALRSRRRYVGVDLDPNFVEIARRRVTKEHELSTPQDRTNGISTTTNTESGHSIQLKTHGALTFRSAVESALCETGFDIVQRDVRLGAVTVDIAATDQKGNPWNFLMCGALTAVRNGLARRESLWNTVGRALLIARDNDAPVVILTSHLPLRASEGDAVLRSVGASVIFDVINPRSDVDLDRLQRYANNIDVSSPITGFWKDTDLVELARVEKRAGG